MMRSLSLAVLILGGTLAPAGAHPPAPPTCQSHAYAPVTWNASLAEQKRALVRSHADQVREIHRDYADAIRHLNQMRSAAIRLPDPYRRHRLASIDQQKREAAHVRRQRLADVNYVYQKNLEQWRYAKQVGSRTTPYPY